MLSEGGVSLVAWNDSPWNANQLNTYPKNKEYVESLISLAKINHQVLSFQF